MKLTLSTDIHATPQRVWDVVSDIENSASYTRAITRIEVLEPAGPSLVGLKWRETRMMFGKEATEVMWITEAEEPSYYCTRAESHGSVYTTRIAVEPMDDGARLTLTFEGMPQTFGAKFLWALTGWMAKGALRKAVAADLEDINAAAEDSPSS